MRSMLYELVAETLETNDRLCHNVYRDTMVHGEPKWNSTLIVSHSMGSWLVDHFPLIIPHDNVWNQRWVVSGNYWITEHYLEQISFDT